MGSGSALTTKPAIQLAEMHRRAVNAFKRSAIKLLLATTACSGSPPQQAKLSAKFEEAVFVRAVSADCLLAETLATPLEAKGAALRVPVRATREPFRLPTDLRLLEGLALGEQHMAVSDSRGSWYLLENPKVVGRLADNLSSHQATCAEAGPTIRAAIHRIQTKLGLVLASPCKWRDRASRRELEERECSGVREFGANERIDIEFRTGEGHFAAIAIASGALALHAVNYGGGHFVTCRRQTAESDSSGLVASALEYSRDEPEWDYAEVVASGCVGWLVGEVNAQALEGFDLEESLAGPADPR